MELIRQSKSSTLPVSVDEMKRYLNIDYARDDDVLTDLIWAADEYIEKDSMGRVFVNQSWKLYLNAFQSTIYLPHPPLTSLTSLQYYDSDNALQSLVSGTDFHVVKSDTINGYVVPVATTDWPATYERPDAVQVTYECGTANNIYKQLIKTLVAGWYDDRYKDITGEVGRLMMALRTTYYV